MPMQRRGREGGLVKPQARQGVAKICRDEGIHRNVAVLRRGVAIAHNMEFLCFVLFFFFRCFEDLSVGLMRTQ